MSLKFFSIVAAAVIPALCAADDRGYEGNDPVGTISYSLPATSLLLDVEAECEAFHAGVYAKYAAKYLGIDVPQKDENTCRITSVKVTPYTEADQASRFLLDMGGQDVDLSFLQLTSCGLVAMPDAGLAKDVLWRFPANSGTDMFADAIVSNLSSGAATLYRKGEDANGRVAVQQNVMVAKTLEQKASETASLIFSLRKKRMQIITGDTDATYSGEAMGAAIDEIARLEKEYMTMFTGYSEKRTQKMTFDIVPEKDKKMYVAFRVSETAGLLPADELSGKPVALEIIPQSVAEPQGEQAKANEKKAKDSRYIVYRMPAVCVVKLNDGKNLLFQGRLPIYQFGTDSTLPLNTRLKSKK